MLLAATNGDDGGERRWERLGLLRWKRDSVVFGGVLKVDFFFLNGLGMTQLCQRYTGSCDVALKGRNSCLLRHDHVLSFCQFLQIATRSIAIAML